jgi:hypothetical protein
MLGQLYGLQLDVLLGGLWEVGEAHLLDGIPGGYIIERHILMRTSLPHYYLRHCKMKMMLL